MEDEEVLDWGDDIRQDDEDVEDVVSLAGTEDEVSQSQQKIEAPATSSSGTALTASHVPSTPSKTPSRSNSISKSEVAAEKTVTIVAPSPAPRSRSPQQVGLTASVASITSRTSTVSLSSTPVTNSIISVPPSHPSLPPKPPAATWVITEPPTVALERVRGRRSDMMAAVPLRRSSRSRSPELPYPWSLRASRTSGDKFYYNSVTKETSWHLPEFSSRVKGRSISPPRRRNDDRDRGDRYRDRDRDDRRIPGDRDRDGRARHRSRSRTRSPVRDSFHPRDVDPKQPSGAAWDKFRHDRDNGGKGTDKLDSDLDRGNVKPPHPALPRRPSSPSHDIRDRRPSSRERAWRQRETARAEGRHWSPGRSPSPRRKELEERDIYESRRRDRSRSFSPGGRRMADVHPSRRPRSPSPRMRSRSPPPRGHSRTPDAGRRRSRTRSPPRPRERDALHDNRSMTPPRVQETKRGPPGTDSQWSSRNIDNDNNSPLSQPEREGSPTSRPKREPLPPQNAQFRQQQASFVPLQTSFAGVPPLPAGPKARSGVPTGPKGVPESPVVPGAPSGPRRKDRAPLPPGLKDATHPDFASDSRPPPSGPAGGSSSVPTGPRKGRAAPRGGPPSSSVNGPRGPVEEERDVNMDQPEGKEERGRQYRDAPNNAHKRPASTSPAPPSTNKRNRGSGGSDRQDVAPPPGKRPGPNREPVPTVRQFGRPSEEEYRDIHPRIDHYSPPPTPEPAPPRDSRPEQGDARVPEPASKPDMYSGRNRSNQHTDVSRTVPSIVTSAPIEETSIPPTSKSSNAPLERQAKLSDAETNGNDRGSRHQRGERGERGGRRGRGGGPGRGGGGGEKHQPSRDVSLAVSPVLGDIDGRASIGGVPPPVSNAVWPKRGGSGGPATPVASGPGDGRGGLEPPRPRERERQRERERDQDRAQGGEREREREREGDRDRDRERGLEREREREREREQVRPLPIPERPISPPPRATPQYQHHSRSPVANTASIPHEYSKLDPSQPPPRSQPAHEEERERPNSLLQRMSFRNDDVPSTKPTSLRDRIGGSSNSSNPKDRGSYGYNGVGDENGRAPIAVEVGGGGGSGYNGGGGGGGSNSNHHMQDEDMEDGNGGAGSRGSPTGGGGGNGGNHGGGNGRKRPSKRGRGGRGRGGPPRK